MSAERVSGLGAALNYVAVGSWMQVHGYDTSKRFATREEVFDAIAVEVADKEVLYLEFGVFSGRATRYWSKLLRNPNSKIHGFDSFEGLPEAWLQHRPKGHFSTNGSVPQIDDDRIQWFKGWFENTLPGYQCPRHEILVINIDADLYSSTKCVLDNLRSAIVPGTYIYFDELNHCQHELRAFEELIVETGMKFSLVGVTRTLAHACFRRVA
jgi:hypothetical protein